MPIEPMRVRITGTHALLMHANRGLTKSDPEVQEMKRLTSKRKKTEEDDARIAELEWRLGLYYDPEIGPYLKGDTIHACIRDGGKKSKQGKLITEAVWISQDQIPLEYSGPRDIDRLYLDRRFVDARPVRVQQARVTRTRPFFPKPWAATFDLTYDSDSIDHDDLLHIIDEAGRRSGLGELRPQLGRFTVEEVSMNANSRGRG